jgi:hypothetical protein
MTIANKGLVTGDCKYVFSIFMPCLVIIYIKLMETILRSGYKRKGLRKLGGRVWTTFLVASSSEHSNEPSDPTHGR